MDEFIKFTELPRLLFAHNFGSKTYDNKFVGQKNFLEIGYISYGDIYCRCGSDEGIAHEGEFYCLTKSGDTVCKSAAPSEHHCIGLTGEYVNKTGRNFLSLIASERVKSLIDGLILNANTEPENTQKTLSLVFAIVSEVNSALGSSVTPPEISGEITYVNALKRHIAANISKPLPLGELADHVGLSVGYMCVIFKKITGMTIVAYINKQRVDRMKSLMTDLNLSVKEACRQVGISDPAYASRLFKKIERQTIKDYKITHKKTIE